MEEQTQGATLNALLDIQKLEKIESDLCRGCSQDLGYSHLFGGHAVAQALSAAKPIELRMVNPVHPGRPATGTIRLVQACGQGLRKPCTCPDDPGLHHRLLPDGHLPLSPR